MTPRVRSLTCAPQRPASSLYSLILLHFWLYKPLLESTLEKLSAFFRPPFHFHFFFLRPGPVPLCESILPSFSLTFRLSPFALCRLALVLLSNDLLISDYSAVFSYHFFQFYFQLSYAIRTVRRQEPNNNHKQKAHPSPYLHIHIHTL